MNDILLWEEDVPFFKEEYGQAAPSLTPFLLDSTDGKKRGCMIVCPGGGYGARMDYEGAPISKRLNEVGISSFVLNYRVAPYNGDAYMADVNRAVRLIRSRADEFGIDPEKIGLIGFSAGGHLACAGATHFDGGLDTGDEIDRVSSRPNAAILSYGVNSLMEEITHADTRNRFIGYSDDPDKTAYEFSGENSVTELTPPMLIWHTAGDTLVPVENALRMASAMSAKNIPFELHIFPEGDHGDGLFGDVACAREWFRLAADWLSRIGF